MNFEGIGSRSRMRAVLAALVALALLVTMFVAENAQATSGLTLKRAKSMSTKLLKKQLRDRDRRLVEARYLAPKRVNRKVIRFSYDDLNRNGVVCTATIQVRRTGLKFRASFLKTNCERPGAEAIAFRGAARTFGVRFARKARSIRRSTTRYTNDAQACEDLRVPQNRQRDASLMLTTGLAQASARPVFGTIDSYASTLQGLRAADPQLAAGANAWRDYINTVRALPSPAGGWCGALDAWAKKGWTDQTAPVNLNALRTSVRRIQADGAQVRRTGRYLRTKGIDRFTVVAFTADDFIGGTAPGESETR